MSELAKVFSTDVLVIGGGGIAGLSAANKAAEQGVDVLIADKSTAGYGGQLPFSGGSWLCVPPDKVDATVRFLVEEGEYLNDQELTEAFVKDTYPFIQEVADWGPFSFEKEVDGTLMLRRGGGNIGTPQRHMTLTMFLKRALQKGAKVLNKIYIVDLLTQDGRVVGAVGFHYQTGEFYVIQSKATILSCGAGAYKGRPLFHPNCGEGVVMAYNAGAELRSAEFGNMYQLSNKYTHDDGFWAGTRFRLNALGEDMHEKYPDINPPKEWSVPWIQRAPDRVIRAAYQEIASGRGPIYFDASRLEHFAVGGASKETAQRAYAKKMQSVGLNIAKEKVEQAICPGHHSGPIRIGLNCETTIPGVYATGDASFIGSAAFGSVSFLPGGCPLAFALVTGFRAGTAAGKAVATLPAPEFNSSEVERLKKDIFAPLGVKDGYDPYDAIKHIQEVVFLLKNSFIKQKDRLEKALSMIEKIKAKLPNLKARDSHELVRCHEAKSMAFNAEILYKTSLMRTESRGSNIREDYPERDDKSWLKWIIIKKEKEEMKLSTEPVPIAKYKLKPAKKA